MSTSDNEPPVKVLLFGLGAIGGFYAFILSRAPNVSLSVVARTNYEVVKQQGLTIESHNHRRHQVHFDAVYRSPDEAGHTFDYIVCAHKAIDPTAIPPIFQSVADTNTTFVVMQNGVGNEDPFRAIYPKCTIISGVIWVGATQTSPGLIEHMQAENTEIGLFPNEGSSPKQEQGKLEQFAAMMRQGGTNISIEKNVQAKRWEKVVWNVAWSSIGEPKRDTQSTTSNLPVPLYSLHGGGPNLAAFCSGTNAQVYCMLTRALQTTLTGVDTQSWLSKPEAVEMTKRLMLEVISVGQRCGVPLEEELVSVLLERINSIPGIYSSMYVDAKEGRRLEVDVILGYPVKRAKDFGMDVPTLATLYALLKAVDGRLGK